VKRIFLSAILCSIIGLYLATALLANPTIATAQIATPTPQSPGDILAQAQSASDQAQKASNDASNAINAVNSMLSFIQVAAIVIGTAVAVTGGLLTAAGVRQLREYSSELEKARGEMADMRDQLKTQADEMRSRADNAIRALTLLQLGEQQLESRNTQSALRTYLEAYDLDPDNRATNYFLGHIYTEEQDIKKGIEHLERALAGGGRYPPAEASLAYALRLQADHEKDPTKQRLGYAQSEELFLKALADDPAVRDINGESVWAVLGGLYKKQHRVSDAIDAYQNAEQVTPQNSYPIINLAMLHFTEGDTDIAQRYFKRSKVISERALDGNPFDYWKRFDLAIADLALGLQDDAQRQIALAISQVQSASPLEILARDLDRLAKSPQPPVDVDKLVKLVEQAIVRLRAKGQN